MNHDGRELLNAENLCIRVPGRLLVDDLTIDVHPGEFIAVLGQNGSGKSLSMLTLCGLRKPDGGEVRFHGEPVASTKRSALARHLSLMPQVNEDIFPSTVRETALVGRYPHVDRLSWESEEDRSITNAALARLDLESFAERDVSTLSGGERRRLAVAQILAQQPKLYLLDEPTNHLDPQHQLDVMRIFREEADRGAGVVASLHDVNLASRFADRCLLLFGDGRWRLGERDSVLTEECLSELYGTSMQRVHWNDTSLFVAVA